MHFQALPLRASLPDLTSRRGAPQVRSLPSRSAICVLRRTFAPLVGAGRLSLAVASPLGNPPVVEPLRPLNALTHLPPLAPPELTGFIATMTALTPVRDLAASCPDRFAFASLALRAAFGWRSPLRSGSCVHCNSLAQHTTTNHPHHLPHRLRVSRRGNHKAHGHGPVIASPLTSRLADKCWPNRVHFRCGLLDSFHCSPPRLTATQLFQVLSQLPGPDWLKSPTPEGFAASQRTSPVVPTGSVAARTHDQSPSLPLHHSITPSLHHSITPSLHHSITPSLHHSITPSLHHSITPSLHHSITRRPPPPLS